MNHEITAIFSLEGKRALVTGAGRGIGRTLAKALALAGAHVTLAARSRVETEDTAHEIAMTGGQAEALVLDVTDISAVEKILGGAYAFDILLNNAGTNRPKFFVDVTPEDYDTVLNLNLRGAFFTAQAVARGMISRNKPGSIINMSSQMGLVGGPNRSIYCASKAGLEGLTKSMALDLAPYGIRANTICPTFIETPMTAGFLADPNFKASILNKIKLGRLGRPEDLIGAALFLASEASALVTGTHILVDGGWTAD